MSVALSQVPLLLADKAKGGRIFVPGGPIEPICLAREFANQPHTSADLTFCGMMIPGINMTDWAAAHPRAQAEVFLPSPHLASTIATCQTRILPLHYSAAYRYLTQALFRAAVFHVCPPDQKGKCNLSLSADSSPAFVDRDVFKLGIINHGLPKILGAPSVSVSMFDAIVEIDAAPISILPANQPDVSSAIGTHVAALVKNGATLQTGIGKLPGAIMAALSGHRDLKLHSGLIGDWALDLLTSGALDQSRGSLTAGVVLGTPALHDALGNCASVSLVPISQTHSVTKLAGIDNFTSINAALEIDLFGQINCEYAGNRAIAGVGGALDFLRGARASKDGKPIIMVACESKDGVSRIVPRLTSPTVSIPRSDPPILVTEYGSVDLEPLDVQARARAIIALAGPRHREALAQSWQDMKI